MDASLGMGSSKLPYILLLVDKAEGFTGTAGGIFPESVMFDATVRGEPGGGYLVTGELGRESHTPPLERSGVEGTLEGRSTGTMKFRRAAWEARGETTGPEGDGESGDDLGESPVICKLRSLADF